MEVDPVAPNPGENITITAHVKLDKATTKISSDLVFAAVDHNKFDGCAGATIKAPLGIATVVMPPAGCPLVPGDDIVFKRYVSSEIRTRNLLMHRARSACCSGDYEFRSQVSTSKHMMEGSNTSKLSGTAQDGDQFICVSMTLDNEVPIVGTVKPNYLVNSAVNGHYEDPNTGCGADEKAFTIQGLTGEVCAPSCTTAACPTDVPAGVTASPQCALQDQSGNKYCVLLCTPSVEDDQCGDKASCKPIQGQGVCTYDSR